MNSPTRLARLRWLPPIASGLLLGFLLAGVVPCRAADAKSGESTEAARAGLLPGAILHREAGTHSWRVVKPNESIHGEELLVAVPAGSLESKNGAVRLSLLSNLARLSPYPALESAVRVHDDPQADLTFTLDRGRVDVTNVKAMGPAHVKIRVGKDVLELTLDEPKTRVALELYSRWPRGVPFSAAAKDASEPIADLVLVVMSGEAELRAGGSRFAMRAPPGPASFHWDNIAGPDPGPQRLEQLPAWASTANATPQASQVAVVLKSLEQRLLEANSVQEALAENLSSDNADARRLGVYGLGALDDLPQLLDALGDPKHDDVREAAVLALRHWIGRGPGQDLRLHETLIKDKHFSANQAGIVLQLLHSFGDADIARPATYETLIDYLLHDKLAVRQLAAWHLYRLAPAGKDIPYDPTASPADRERAYDRWKELIPNGKLPKK